jgi:hypothetical protein
VRPPYYKPPRDTCDLCGRSLYGAERYRVRLYLRHEALAATPYKTLVLCRDCLDRLRRDPTLKRLFHIRYRRMPTLGAPRQARPGPAGKNQGREIQSAQKKKKNIDSILL